MPGDENVVESVIGQVSGRPIFADELLAPIADQLQQKARQLSQDQFIEQARRIISDRLSEVILNELFLAEAEASLTEQQQMGLLAFLKDLQEKNIAERGGTIFGATKKIAEEEEMSLQEFQQAQKDKALIQNLLYERISPRVIVSWRDVQREYELRKAEFNPPATVTLQMLRLNATDQKDAIDSVQSRLNTGTPFDSVVQELSLGEFVAPAGGGSGRFTLPAGGLGALEIADTYKPALAKVKAEAGATTEAIESRGEMRWLHIKDIEQPPPRSLFDVQEQLIGELQARRFIEERNKYINNLLQRGIYDELDEMSRRVLAVALLRYGR